MKNTDHNGKTCCSTGNVSQTVALSIPSFRCPANAPEWGTNAGTGPSAPILTKVSTPESATAPSLTKLTVTKIEFANSPSSTSIWKTAPLASSPPRGRGLTVPSLFEGRGWASCDAPAAHRKAGDQGNRGGRDRQNAGVHFSLPGLNHQLRHLLLGILDPIGMQQELMQLYRAIRLGGGAL